MKKLIPLLMLFISAFASEGEIAHIITPRGGTDPGTDNKMLVKKFYNAFSNNDSESMQGLLAPNYRVQDSNMTFDSHYSKYDAFSKNLTVRLSAFHEALPNFKLSVIEMLSEGNKVLARIQIEGIQRGAFLGVEPTGKPVTLKIFALFTIENGRIAILNEVWNELGVMKQIGYIAL